MSQHRNKRRQRGQVIVIAIAVMFLLAFVAGLFLALISRNTGRTARGGDVVQAQYLAEAGIRYADQQLTHSIDGADWRPDPQPVPNTPNGDPDYTYLRNGFTRFNQGNGRFLLRVSWQPVQLYSNPDDPADPKNGEPVDSGGQPTKQRERMIYPALGKYIRIEAIGRRGVVDANDPTTFGNADPLRRELVAFKPIGITDYARFVTNKDRSDTTMVLGSYPFATTPPYEDQSNHDRPFREFYYGPIRVNGDLLWTGLNTVVLNAMENLGANAATRYTTAVSRAAGDLLGVDRDDTVAVAGRVFHDNWPWGDAPNNQVHLTNRAPGAAVVDEDLLPSILSTGAENRNFRTAGGAYRDNYAGQSGAGKVRSVTRLEPPAMDETDPSTGVLRYRLLTRNTGVVPPGKSFNTGQNGLGMGIYIDNGNEKQEDTRFRRLTDEWAETGTGREGESFSGSAWHQHLYTPPGAEVYLDPTPSRDLNSGLPKDQSQGTIVITRHDGKQWKDENGGSEGYTRRYRYPLRQVYDNAGALVDSETYGSGGDDFRDQTGAYKTFQNGVIFMEGNLRLQGKLPADWVGTSSGRVVGQHLTLVTMGTAYIEGNLLKGDAAVVNDVNKFGPGLQLGSITVIAKDYVCVNTTAYFLRQPSAATWNFALGNPYTELGTPGEAYTTGGFSAVNPALYAPDNSGMRQTLFLLQTAEANPGAASVVYANLYTSGSSNYTGIPLPGGNPQLVSPSSSLSAAENVWQHRAFPLVQATTTANNYTSWGEQNRSFEDWYSIVYRPTYAAPPAGAPGAEFGGNYNQPLWLSRVAATPMDVRIEAVLYAQEGSFFVIPGEWMNGNPADLRAANLDDSLRYFNPVAAGWRLMDLKDQGGRSSYPFFLEPADIRVVVNGAIAENVPADKDYQTAWSRHWGWTPQVRADGTDGQHNGEGLVYMYDQSLRLPLRFDRFNRPLPPTPALPVSPDLVFFGEAAG